MSSGRSLPAALGASVIGGLLMWAVFPPLGLGYLAAPAVACLTWAWHGQRARRATWLGLLAGMVCFVPMLAWLHVIGTDAVIGLALYCAVWFALLGLSTAVVSQLRWWPVAVACLWVLAETLRGLIPYGGFPWGRLAFGQPDTVTAGWASLIGLSGLSFALALAGTLLVEGVRARRAWPVALAVALILLPGLWNLSAKTPGSATIAVVQGGTPQTGMGAMDVRQAVLRNHVRETLTLAREVDAGVRPQPDLVIWPENSSDIDPFADPTAAALISEAARAIDAPILVGAIVAVPGNAYGVWNLGVLWDPETGPGARYAKRHPVPFGEYIPMRSLVAPLIARLDRIPVDFIAGEEAGVIEAGGVLLGDLICFEVAYDDVVQPLLTAEVQLISVQTNNATYAGTAQPDQQFQITRMRAIESGRWVAVAATTGISAFIAPDGAVSQSLATGAVGSLVADVPLAEGSTWGTRLGPVLQGLANLGALIALSVTWATAWRQRRRSAHRVDA